MSGSQRSISIGSSAATPGILRLTGATINSNNNVILRNSGTGSLTITSTVSSTGPMALDLGGATDNVILIDNSGAITISATVTGVSRTLTLSGTGSGALTLSAANTYTGTTQLASGILRAGNDAAFSSSLLLLNGGTLSSDSATARSFANNVRLGGNVAFGDGTNAGTLSFGAVNLNAGTRTLTTVVATTATGAVTNGSLTKAGTATLSLTNAASSFSTLSISAGTVSIGANTTVTGLAGSGGGLVLAAGTLSVNASADQTFGQPITGAGNLTKSGAGALVLSAANSGYSGTTRLTAGVLRAGDDAAFGTGPLALDGGTITGTGATARTFANAVSVGGDVQFGDASGTGPLTFGGAVNLGSAARSLTTLVSTTFSGAVTNGSLTKAGAATLALTNSGNTFGTLTINAGTVSIGANTAITGLGGSGGALNLAAGTLSYTSAANETVALPFSGSGSFTKSGAGALTLTGSSGGYAGTTTVSAGSLVANGNLGGTVTVSNGATLAGSGTVGTVTINSGATLSPGNSPGVLTTGDITWAGGGNYNWQLLSGTLGAGIGWDFVRGGALTITADSSSRFNVNLWSLSSINPDVSGTAQNFSFTTSGTYTIGTFSSVSGATGDWYTINTAATNGTGGFTGYNAALGGFTLVSSGTSLDLVYTHTPLSSYSYIGGTGVWSDTANWSPADSPEGDAAITFDGPGGVSTNDIPAGTGPNQLTSVTSLSFSGSAGGYTVAGNPLTVGAGGITNDSPANQVIATNVTLAAPVSLASNVAGVLLTLSGTLDTAGNALTVTGVGNSSLGVVTGTGSFTKTGSGTATLTGSLAAPSVAVNASSIRLDGSNLLLDSGSVSVGGGTLDLLANSDTIGAFSITAGTLAGSGTLTAATYSLGGGTIAGNLGGNTATASSGSTALDGTLAGNLTVAGGTVALGAAERIANSGTVTITSGSLGLGSFNDTVGSFAITGGVLGGSGTLAAATYSLGGGTLAGNLGAGTATASSGSTALNGTLAGSLTLSGGTVTLGAADRIANSGTVTINSGSLGLGSFNDTVGSFVIAGGALGGSGTLTAASYALTGGTVSANLGGGSLTANFGAATLAGTSGATTVTVNGGTLTTSGANKLADSGSVTLSSGGLTLGGNDTVGTYSQSGGTLAGSATLTAGTYALTGGTVNANLGGGVVTASSGNTSIAGTVAATTVTISGGTLALASPGRLANTAAVTMSAGGLTLGGNETVGTYTQSGGTLAGSGTLTASSYSISGGTLSATLGAGQVTMSGGSLTATGGKTLSNAITIGGTGGPVVYSQNFNSLGTGLPTGWTTGTGATNATLGTSVAFNTAQVSWGNASGQFNNYASATGLTSGATTTAQNNSTDRALGVRQTASFGDPGASFSYAFTTTGQTLDSVSLDLMLLSPQANSTTWSIQYGVGTSPTSYTTLGTWTDPGTWGTTSITFSGTAVSGMSNLANGVFRVVALSAASGGGTRDSIAIDNVTMVRKSAATATLGVADASAVTYSGPIAVTGTAVFTAASGGTATFSGAISGSAGAITKTGAGVVAVSGSGSYGGATTVSEGILEVLAGGRLAGTPEVTVANGAMLRAFGAIGASGSETFLTIDGVLSGNGRVHGAVGGSGSIDPGMSPGILTVTQIAPTGGLDHNFEFTALAPVYAASGSGALNDILHITAATPFTAALSGSAGNAVNVYFNSLEFADGATFVGGFFVDNAVSIESFLAQVSGAQFNYFVADAGGGTTYQSVVYRTLAEWNAFYLQDLSIKLGGLAVTNAAFETGTVNGYVTTFAVVPEPTALVLAGIGLAAVGLAARRRRDRQPPAPDSRRCSARIRCNSRIVSGW